MALLRGKIVDGVFEPSVPLELYGEQPDLFTMPAPGVLVVARAVRVDYGPPLVPGGWKRGTLEEIKFRIHRTETGRLRATCIDGQIDVEGEDVAELRDRLDRIVQAKFGDRRRVVLMVGRGGNA
jgi:hypothetical protein